MNKVATIIAIILVANVSTLNLKGGGNVIPSTVGSFPPVYNTIPLARTIGPVVTRPVYSGWRFGSPFYNNWRVGSGVYNNWGVGSGFWNNLGYRTPIYNWGVGGGYYGGVGAFQNQGIGSVGVYQSQGQNQGIPK
jgi:hypothetical protein